ncbi:MAG: Xaa-Pro peptidase family protein [Puniceicoccales bacterium]|jgi:Xaa-Pro aminopeptidase|nr:Xaa-Pro peptidase family protein [Puniceicoccales bacterium]
MSDRAAKLFFSNTRTDKNLKYLLGCAIEDNVAAIKHASGLSILASALEINRLRNESNATEIVPIESLRASKTLNQSNLIAAFIGHVTGKKTLVIHENFPFGLASDLLAKGLKIKIDRSNILPERLIKSSDEVDRMKKVLLVVKGCFERTREILRQSKVSENGILKFRNAELTSEFVRREIEDFCYTNGCLTENTIVSCGYQSADPHCQGHGPIHANQLIIIDLFPFDRSSGYYADITRTFLHGTPTAAQENMYETVKVAQEMACKRLKNGVRCSDLMESILKFFASKGYKTDRAATTPHGMFHSLGHGFGLEIHEEPYISNGAAVLKTGNVITIEPGLYYPKIGGVRIEDDFLITDECSINLSENICHDWVIN